MFLTLQLLGKKTPEAPRRGGFFTGALRVERSIGYLWRGRSVGSAQTWRKFLGREVAEEFYRWLGIWMEDFWMEVVVWKMVSFIFSNDGFPTQNFQIYQFQTLAPGSFWEKIRLHCMGCWQEKNISFFLKGKEIQELTTPRWLRVGNLHSMTFCIQFADWLITTLLNAWSFVNFRGLNVFWRCSFVGHITKYWLPNYKFVCVWTFECFSLFLEFLFFWMKIQTNKHHCFALVSTFPGFKKEPYILLMATRNPKANHLGFNNLNPPVGAF